MNRILRNGILLLFALACVGMAGAQAPTPEAAQAAQEKELNDALAAARPMVQMGPADIKLREQAKLHLPVGYFFIPAKEGATVMKAMGNRTGPEFLGLVFSTADEDADAFLLLQYHSSGYIQDDDAKDWNVDDMFDTLKAGTEEANKDRKARGIAELEVLSWIERPHYDAATHQLKWSISTKERGANATPDQGVNYNTYALGREGFISMNLVTQPKAVESQKPKVAQLLSGMKFEDGKRYADFNSSTDHMAEFGLAALIGGVAAKKLGLLALAGVFIAKFFKVIVIGGIAAVAGFFKLRKKKEALAASTDARTTYEAPTPPSEPPIKPPQA